MSNAGDYGLHASPPHQGSAGRAGSNIRIGGSDVNEGRFAGLPAGETAALVSMY
jgi:hypothetical protein